MDFPASPFWDFSLEVYGREGVAPACLGLQNRHGIDVNFLLFCCWLGRAGHGALGEAEIARLHEVVLSWHRDVVRGLRAVRRRLKSNAEAVPGGLREALRRQVARIEIDAEHIEQLVLAAAQAGEPEPGVEVAEAAQRAAANLGGYFGHLEARIEAADRAALGTILGAAFPDLDPTKIEDFCGKIAA